MQMKVATEQIRKTYQQAGEKLRQAIYPSQQQDENTSQLERFLLILSVLQLVLFVPLTWWVRKHPVDAVDIEITHAFQKQKSPFLRYAAITTSILTGSPKLLRVLVVPVGLVLWKMQLRLAAVITLSLSWITEIIKTVIKRTVNRPRPSPLLVHVYKVADGQGFPSGNVIAAVTFWGWLFALGMFLSKGKHSPLKTLLSIPVLFIVLVGPSRIYLGDHWASDVIGGYLLGGTSLSSSLLLYLKVRKKGVFSKE